MSPYVCDCTNVVYMFCVYCIYYYVNKFEARSLFSTSHLKKTCSLCILLMFLADVLQYMFSIFEGFLTYITSLHYEPTCRKLKYAIHTCILYTYYHDITILS